MTSFFLEFALRAALIAAGTAAVLSALRIRTASVRHAAWAAVVLAMLLLPISMAGGLRLSFPVLEPAPVTDSRSRASSDPGQTQPENFSGTTGTSSAGSAQDSTQTQIPGSKDLGGEITSRVALLSAYFGGALILLLRLAIGTGQANRLRRSAEMVAGRLTSDRCTTPITVGWFHPALILPRGWDRWSAAQLDCVLTHEHQHARRRDPLFQWLSLLNRAVFWFHPLAWWLERRLALLAEEACDTAVLAAGHSPQDYSEYLLEMARAVTRGHGRVQLVGMAMPGTGLSRRVRLIVTGLPLTRLSRARLLCTIIFCLASSALFASGTLAERATSAPPVSSEALDAAREANASPNAAGHVADAPLPSTPIRSVVPQPPAARHTNGQAQSPRMQITFEIVSIRPCEDAGPVGGRGSNSPRERVSPGYASWGCVSLAQLIDEAWGGGTFPHNVLLNTVRLPPGHRPDAPQRVRGGPSWVEQERWAIEIRLSGDTTDLTGSARHDLVRAAMLPQLQAMIRDRFQLKLRTATEEQPMYALTLAAGGLKMTKAASEQCWQVPPDTPRGVKPTPPPGSEGKPSCSHQINGGRVRGNEVLRVTDIKLADFAKYLSEEMDRYVLDRTGIAGRFSFSLEFAADEHTPGITETRARFARAAEELLGRPAPEQVKGDGPTIFKALEALGLKLEPTRGPTEYLLIESVQRPRPN